ncbi:MAG: cytochrome c biogenesis protein CcsA [Pseudohongiella sp.]|nr:cytochrome c biogenesis protein CcsA [Pseudohongiella sp.]MDP2127179.1 cytochrome c biogenesis protein CcsA [Pseudohongiella sp.]
MPITLLSGIAAIALYLLSFGLQSQSVRTGAARAKTDGRVLILGFAGVAAHILSAWTLIHRDAAYHFGLTEISTLIFASIALLTMMSSARRPIGSLILGVLPLAIVTIVVSLSIRSTYPAQQLGAGIASHVILSILAYSLFTLAALQSAFLAFQNYQLKHHHVASVMRIFPPLQEMERLLFELLWAAQILLSLAIAAGFMFVSDFTTQGLAHKMFFSVLAWAVFAVLLWGRHQLGWRGNTAIKGTLTGFVFLLLGFYGSKFVLEFLL